MSGLDKVVEEDKKLVERFSMVPRTLRISLGRGAKYVSHLKIVAETLPGLTKSYRGVHSASRESIELLSIHINEVETYRPHTKSDYVTVLKRFYQWVKTPPEEYNNWRRSTATPRG